MFSQTRSDSVTEQRKKGLNQRIVNQPRLVNTLSVVTQVKILESDQNKTAPLMFILHQCSHYYLSHFSEDDEEEALRPQSSALSQMLFLSV